MIRLLLPSLLLVTVTGIVGLGAAELRPLPVPGTTLIIGVPDDWTAVLPADGTAIRLRRPAGEAGLAISVTTLPTGDGPAAFTQRSLAELQKLLFQFDLLDWEFTELRGTRTWSRLHFRFIHGETRWEEELWLTVDQATGTSPAQAVAVAFSATPATWAAWKPVFDRCLNETAASRPVLTR